MKKNVRILCISILIFFTNDLFSQAIQHQDTSMFYKEFTSKGDYFNGIKVGKWIDISPNGTIYAESSYDSAGKPIGIWKINFPDGSLRRVTEYSNLGVIKWKVYRYKRKLMEVVSEPVIQDNICVDLNAFETSLFEKEKNVLSSQTVVSDGIVQQGNTTWRTDPFIAAVEISDKLVENKFSGVLLIWNMDNTLRRKCIYTKGIEYRICYFYNNKQAVSKQDEYSDNKLVKTITLKKDGTQKIKTY